MKIFLISTILLLLCSCSNDEPEQTTHIYSITKEQYEQQVKGHIWESNNGRFFDAQGNEHSTAGWLGGDRRIHIMKVEGDQYFEYFEPDRHMMDDKVHCSVFSNIKFDEYSGMVYTTVFDRYKGLLYYPVFRIEDLKDDVLTITNHFSQFNFNDNWEGTYALRELRHATPERTEYFNSATTSN